MLVTPPDSLQLNFWNRWNSSFREKELANVSYKQADLVMFWLQRLSRPELEIIDVGCGAGWLCPRLSEFGRVTGTDLSDQVLARAAIRYPQVNFVPGDFMALDFGKERFDVAVSLEVLSHVADQPAFVKKVAGLIRPGGYFIIGTQNKPALMRNNIPPPEPGQLRRWVDRHELAELLGAHFDVLELCSITPQFNKGALRLINSYKLHRLAQAAMLGPVARLVRRVQERAWLGWTLMALARRRL